VDTFILVIALLVGNMGDQLMPLSRDRHIN
jgi:hypothetical protein